jgi:hypothetical protein
MDGDQLNRGEDRLQCCDLARPAESDQGNRAGPTADERERIKALEREVRELRQVSEILRKADPSAFSVQMAAPVPAGVQLLHEAACCTDTQDCHRGNPAKTACYPANDVRGANPRAPSSI